MTEYLFKLEEDEVRADKIKLPGITRSALQKLISDGNLSVDGKTVRKKNLVLKYGETVRVLFDEPKLLDVLPENIPLDVVYEDSHVIIVNKPKGMVVHPAAGHYSGTLVNALLYHCKGNLSAINGVIRPGIVHRLDKMTSGLLAAAKSDAAHNSLCDQLKERKVIRRYMAVVHGRLKEQRGIIEADIARHPTDRKKMCVAHGSAGNARYAKTEYKVLEEYKGFSLAEFRLHTGRTHQIRVHMAYLGHPVLGDEVYGKPSKLCEGQCLHAKKIGFIHPATKEYMEFESDLPGYFTAVLDKIII